MTSPTHPRSVRWFRVGITLGGIVGFLIGMLLVSWYVVFFDERIPSAVLIGLVVGAGLVTFYRHARQDLMRETGPVDECRKAVSRLTRLLEDPKYHQLTLLLDRDEPPPSNSEG